MMSLAGLMITLLYWCIYKEKLTWPQFIGMGTILVAVVMMGFFQEDTDEAELGPGVVDDPDREQKNMAALLITVVGSMAALSFSLEAIFIKWLVKRHVEGEAGAQIVLLFDGIYGLIMLAVLTWMGEGLQLVDWMVASETIVGGIGTSIALVFVNYGIANGIAGIAFSIANSFPAWHAIFNWLILGQILSTGQLFGIILAVLGGVILSIHDYISACFSSDDDNNGNGGVNGE